MDGQTFNDLGNAMLDIAREKRSKTSDPDVGRDLSLSITSLEDALTRYNSAAYRLRGTWGRQDPDKLP